MYQNVAAHRRHCWSFAVTRFSQRRMEPSRGLGRS